MNTSSLYERDFYAWTQRQAQLLREGKLAEVDIDHLIEEIESMGASERNQLQSRLKVLLAHLLKWQYQPHLRSRNWSATIKEQIFGLCCREKQLPVGATRSIAGTARSYKGIFCQELAYQEHRSRRDNVSAGMPLQPRTIA